jgi:PAS domain S-box-containing protein
MEPTYTLRTLIDLEPGDHLCCIYETEEEHRALLTPFLRQGLERGEKVIYIVDAHTAEIIKGYLQDDGMEVEPYLASGQMSILSVDDAYMRDGVFEPDAMITLLRSETERALAQGYTTLRVTGEMSWALRGLSGSERLIEYEAKLNEFFPSSKCIAICQYDKQRFESELLLDVLATHPIAVIGTEVFDNFYYIPPGDFLGPNTATAKLKSWLHNLAHRKGAEERIKQKTEFLNLVLESLPHPFYVIDAFDYTIKVANYAAHLGRLSKETTCYALTHRSDKPCGSEGHPCPLEQLKKTKQPVTVEHIHYDKDGNPRNVEVHAYPIFDSEGNVSRIIESSMDITERKRAEEELKTEKEKLNSIVEGIGAGLALLDVDTRIMWSNDILQKWFGPKAKIAGKYCCELYDLKDPEKECAALLALRTGQVEQGEAFAHTIRGEERYFELTTTPIKNEDGEIVQLLELSMDLTERKRAEELLNKLTHDLGERVKELNCVYGISKLAEKQDISLEEILQGSPDLIAASWQYPEVTCARIILDGQEYKTENFKETNWKQTSSIFVHGEEGGTIEVNYLEEKPEIDEGPFLKEERDLIDAIAERLGKTIELKRADEVIRDLARFPSENPNPVIRVATDGTLLYVNEAGVPLLKVWGCQIGQALPDEWRKLTVEVFSSGSSKDAEVDCDDRILSLTFSPVKDADYVNIYGLDVTERKRAEGALEKAHDELEKRVEERTAQLVAANEQLRQEIEERKRAEEALQYRAKFEKLVSAISTNFMNLSADEIDSGINHALKRIGEFADVDRSYVFQFHDKGTKMDNTHEWCAKGIEPHIQTLKGLLVDGFPWATGKLKRLETLYIPRVADLPPEASPERKEFQSEGIQSLVNVPMVSGGSLVAFLGFDSVRAEKSWAEEDMALLKTIGEIIVNTLERKRAEEEIRHLSQRLIGAMEDERRRVARDLHDELGQAVTGLHFGIEALRNSLPVELKDQETRCDELIGMVEQLGDTVRDLSSELRPDMLDHLGLIPTLEWYIDDFAKRTQGLQIDFQAVGVKKRPISEIEIILYRILQEGLNNIAKHAKAKRVSVLLAYSHPKLILAIKDDGVTSL